MLLRVFGLLAIFMTSTLALIFTWSLRPELSSAVDYKMKTFFPRTIDDMRASADYFGKYRLVILVSGGISTELYKSHWNLVWNPQSFSIGLRVGHDSPGSFLYKLPVVPA